MIDKKTVMIIDDHPLFREGLRSLIDRDQRFEVIGEAGCGREGISLIKKLKPDLVLVDISLPDGSGIHLTREIKEISHNIRVMIISMHANIEYITEAFQAGASGYVVKESASCRLLQGIEVVTKGDYFLDSCISNKVIEKLMRAPVKGVKTTDKDYGNLTPREQEIMRLLAEGLSNKEIAGKLFISPKTVDNHRASIMKKLGIHTTVEMVRYAAKLGLIDVELWKE